LSAITQTINSAIGGVTYVPFGNYIIDEAVNVQSSVIVEAGTTFTTSGFPINMKSGSGWNSTIGGKHQINKSGASSLFKFQGSGISVSGITTDETASTGGYSFMLDTTVSLEEIAIKNVKTMGSLGLIADNSAAGIIVNLRLEDVKARLHRGRGSYLTKALAYISLSRCTVDYVNTASLVSANVPAWVFFNNQGLLLDYVDVTGNAGNAGMDIQYGFYFENCQAISVTQMMADTVGSHGAYFRNCSNVDISIFKASLVGGYALAFGANCSNIRAELAYLSGRNTLAVDPKLPPMWTDGTNTNVRISDLALAYYASKYAATSFAEVSVGRISQ
jgi:hypothetical protein